MLYAKELSIRKLIPSPISNRILAISVHPGAVATDQEKAAQEPYGLLGTALVAASRVFFMSPEQGAECSLWAATSDKVEGEENVVQKYQGAYLTQPDDSVRPYSSCLRGGPVLMTWSVCSWATRRTRPRIWSSRRGCGTSASRSSRTRSGSRSITRVKLRG